MISLVIPTYREAGNILETLRRAAQALGSAGEEFEIIVVDDASGDGTAEIAESLSGELPVRVLRRVGKRGLATAVVDGWAIAGGDVLGVMDADLQHPPEALADLAAILRHSQADLALASRYCMGGGTRDWPWIRRMASAGATHLAATVLPLKLSNVTDPMSGMFLVRARALEGISLSPLGYKILLEVLGKGKIERVVEAPYQFIEREHGSSKLGPRQYVEYVAHLARLAWSTGQFRAWVDYSLIGLTGALVNLGVVNVLAEKLAWPVPLALVAAIELAMLWNFYGNRFLTFARRRAAGGFWSRLGRYERICLPGAALNFLVALVLFRNGTSLLLAAAAGVVAGGLVHLLLNIPAIWKIWGES